MPRLVAAILFLLASVAGGGQINWSSAFGSTNLLSTGAAMDEQIVFELGVFSSGFVPSASNTASWAANWQRASLAFYNSDLKYFTGVFSVTSNAAPFAAGTKGYIWGHDGNCTNGEWILLSAPSWTWPTPNPIELPLNWTIGTATQVPVGQANGAGYQMKTAKVGAPLPATTWTEWRSRIFSTAQQADPLVSGPQADPDGDDVVNLAEFALGGHPLMPGTAAGRVIPGMMLSGGRQRLSLRIAKRCDRSVLWSAQASRDLLNWPAGSIQTIQNTGEVLDVIENITTATDHRVFLRPVFQIP